MAAPLRAVAKASGLAGGGGYHPNLPTDIALPNLARKKFQVTKKEVSQLCTNGFTRFLTIFVTSFHVLSTELESNLYNSPNAHSMIIWGESTPPRLAASLAQLYQWDFSCINRRRINKT